MAEQRKVGASLLTTAAERRQFRRSLLAWYDRNDRNLPWRKRSAPQAAYKVLVSEILLQQTRASVVAARYGDFVRRFPSLKALAEADLDQVLTAWAGLGYYARGRNLHRAAQQVREEYGGRFPRTPEGLQTLPGVGRYTAAAIAAIAFEHPVVPVDGNILRLAARLFACSRESPLLMEQIQSLAVLSSTKQATRPTTNPATHPTKHSTKHPTKHPTKRNGDFAQALMDLGALICLPANPRCAACPVAKFCAAGSVGKGADYGARAKPKPRPVRRGVAVLVRQGNRVLLVRRPADGLLGGMRLPPMTGLDKTSTPEVAQWITRGKKYGIACGTVEHTFTHFRLVLRVFDLRLTTRPKTTQDKNTNWIATNRLTEIALPSLGRKVLGCTNGITNGVQPKGRKKQ